jgi:uncharacterized protein (DUF2147 family)
VQNLYDDWANFAYYSIYVLMGFLLACHPILEDAIRRERKRALYVSLGAMIVLLLSVLRIVQSEPLLLACSAVAGWCFIVAVIGFSAGLRQREARSLDYLRESAFPVYLLHQPVIVLLGSAVVELSLGIAAKLALLLSGSVVTTLLLYHYVVRPVPLLRVIHGMKARHDPASGHATHRAGAELPRTAGLWLIGLGLGLGVTVAPGSVSVASVEPHPTGLWWAEGGAAQIEIRRCGPSLCGQVVWLRSPFDENGCQLRDVNNPEPGARGREVLGARILAGLRAEHGQAATWSGGTIYDPGSGRTYRAHVTLTDDGRLAVRGYVGLRFIGRTTTWIRVGSEGTCRPRPSDVPGTRLVR